MVIAIIGRDGSGKSSVAKEIGRLLAKDNLVAIVNTDLTQPTIYNEEVYSLGYYVSTVSKKNVNPYLYKDEKINGLFHAGTIKTDDIFTFESVGLDNNYTSQAEYFISGCGEDLQHTIIDLSSQKTDPFISQVIKADKVLILATADVQGMFYLKSIKPMVKNVANVEYVLSKVKEYEDIETFQELAQIKAKYVLPYSDGIIFCNACNATMNEAKGKSAKKWLEEIKKIAVDIESISNENREDISERTEV